MVDDTQLGRMTFAANGPVSAMNGPEAGWTVEHGRAGPGCPCSAWSGSTKIKNMSIRDLIIVGAGPSGLSAAIAAKKRGLDYQVLEQGVLVNSIYRFPPQMVFFTTPELLEIGGLPFVSPYDKPTRAEALKYYRKVVDVHDLQIAYEETVLSVEREHEGSGGSGLRPGGSGGASASGGSGLRPVGSGGAGGGEPVFAVTTQSKRGVR